MAEFCEAMTPEGVGRRPLVAAASAASGEPLVGVLLDQELPRTIARAALRVVLQRLAHREPELECRICQLPGTLDDLLAPCRCIGSMKYVHRDCLQAWRQRSRHGALRCGVCLATYEGARQLPVPLGPPLYLWKRAHMGIRWLYHWPPAGFRRGGSIIGHWFFLGATPSNSVLRLGAWCLSLLSMTLVAHPLLLIMSAVHEAVLGIDHALDPLVFPDEMLVFMYSVFPAIAGFGHLGLYDRVSVGSEDLNRCAADTMIAVKEFLKHFVEDTLGHPLPNVTRGANDTRRMRQSQPPDFENMIKHMSTDMLRAWTPRPIGLDDATIGAFLLLLAVHVILVSVRSDMATFLRRAPSPLDDAYHLLQIIVPSAASAVGFVLFNAPLCAYFARWTLDFLSVLPMDTLPFHENYIFHLLLSLGCMGGTLMIYEALDAISEDFLTWHASYTLGTVL